MTLISLPAWQFALATGIPSLLLFMIVARLLGKKRRCRKRPAAKMDGFYPPTAETYENRIFQEMVSQQIDSVFNALETVIMAERVKLKSLLLRQTENAPAVQKVLQTGSRDLTGRTQEIAQDLSNQGALDPGHENDPHEDLTWEGQLSRNEAALAMMLRDKTGNKRQRVKAVA